MAKPGSAKRSPAQIKSANLKFRYGIEVGFYDLLLRMQKGKCAICGYVPSSIEKALCLDHDHKTHKIRGLLCLFCNTALGKFKDSPTLLKKAIKYLTKNHGHGKIKK